MNSISIRQIKNKFSIGFYEYYENSEMWVELAQVMTTRDACMLLHYLNGGDNAVLPSA
jgi:hypothetical protein